MTRAERAASLAPAPTGGPTHQRGAPSTGRPLQGATARERSIIDVAGYLEKVRPLQVELGPCAVCGELVFGDLPPVEGDHWTKRRPRVVFVHFGCGWV